MLARSLSNQRNYDPGFIWSATDVMIYVQVDNAKSGFYDVNDLTAMVLDRDPNPKDLVVGTQVVARRPKDPVHVEGKVKEVKEENEKRTFLIEFWDGVEHWNSLEQIRVLTTTKPGGIEAIDFVQIEAMLGA